MFYLHFPLMMLTEKFTGLYRKNYCSIWEKITGISLGHNFQKKNQSLTENNISPAATQTRCPKAYDLGTLAHTNQGLSSKSRRCLAF